MASAIDFSTWNVVDLQKYLKERGVTYSKSKKKELIELSHLARKNNLEIDPNCFLDSLEKDIADKLKISGVVIPHPDSLKGTTDLSHIPTINNFDIYDYLKQSEVYDSNQLRDFNNLEGYRLYKAGYVESIEVVYDVVENVSVVKFLVKPTQRKEDPVNHVPFYKGWIILVSTAPFIKNAFCACKGGSDGACRHTVATLLELAEYADEDIKTSVTSSACQWKKKCRQNTDIPVEVTKLDTSLPGSSRPQAPTIDLYDPCPGIPPPDVGQFYRGIKVLQPNANILYNRYRLVTTNPITENKQTCAVPSLLEKIILVLNWRTCLK